MNKRSGIFTFFLFSFLSVMILLQILSMIQSDRLYERLNHLLGIMSSDSSFRAAQGQSKESPSGVSTKENPGDDGDWLVWNLDGEPENLNEITSTSLYARDVTSGMIFESLLEYDPDTLTMRPLLAESYSVSKDGLEITIRIRKDVHFSDGHPLTADDVLFTYKTIINPGVDAASLASYYKDIDRVEKISDFEVKFIMKRTYFLSLEFTGGMSILPKHIYEFKDPNEFNKHISNPVGSGPYVFEKWDVGREIVLRRNENYWGAKRKLSKIVFRIITNDTAAVQAMRSKNIDYMRPMPAQYTELSNDKEFTKDVRCMSYWHPGVGYFYIGWNEDRPFFKDRNVRLAMTHLVDREKICKYLLNNPDAKIPTGPFYIYGKQNDPNIQPWPFDPEKAKKLLDESGWIDHDGDGIRDKNGVPFKFNYMISSGLSLHEQIGKLVKDEAAKAGIEVTLDPYEWSVFIQKLHDRQFDAVNLSWGGAVEEDPYQIWHSSQIGQGGSNYIGFNNAEADAIIEEARKTLDDDKRNALYHRFHKILHEEQPYTFVYTRPEQRFLDKRFENVIVHKLGVDEREWYVPKNKQLYK
jgi:peptide/nickel transport system substrate-binding protein